MKSLLYVLVLSGFAAAQNHLEQRGNELPSYKYEVVSSEEDHETPTEYVSQIPTTFYTTTALASVAEYTPENSTPYITSPEYQTTTPPSVWVSSEVLVTTTSSISFVPLPPTSTEPQYSIYSSPSSILPSWPTAPASSESVPLEPTSQSTCAEFSTFTPTIWITTTNTAVVPCTALGPSPSTHTHTVLTTVVVSTCKTLVPPPILEPTTEAVSSVTHTTATYHTALYVNSTVSIAKPTESAYWTVPIIQPSESLPLTSEPPVWGQSTPTSPLYTPPPQNLGTTSLTSELIISVSPIPASSNATWNKGSSQTSTPSISLTPTHAVTAPANTTVSSVLTGIGAANGPCNTYIAFAGLIVAVMLL